MSFTLIETKTLGTAAASIEFTSIPQDFTDLYLLVNCRSARTGVAFDSLHMYFNNLTTNFSNRTLFGSGTLAESFAGNNPFVGESPAANATGNTFSNASVYVPNYSGNTNKSYSVDSVPENNATVTNMNLGAHLWSNTAAITSIKFDHLSGNNLVAGSTISLYGILKGSDGIVTTS
jgi:hypothetical protein